MSAFSISAPPRALTGRVDDVPHDLEGAHTGPLVAGVQLGQQEGQQAVRRTAGCRASARQKLFVTRCPSPPAGCLHLQDKQGPVASEAGRSGLRPSQALAVCSPETQAGSTLDKGPPAPQSSQAAASYPAP